MNHVYEARAIFEYMPQAVVQAVVAEAPVRKFPPTNGSEAPRFLLQVSLIQFSLQTRYLGRWHSFPWIIALLVSSPRTFCP